MSDMTLEQAIKTVIAERENITSIEDALVAAKRELNRQEVAIANARLRMQKALEVLTADEEVGKVIHLRKPDDGAVSDIKFVGKPTVANDAKPFVCTCGHPGKGCRC